MKVTYTTEGGRLAFELDADSPKTAFEAVAGLQELFEEPDCGCCKSKAIRCEVREHDGNKYYKVVCNACGAQLDFGQFKDGKGLFVKRWDKDAGRAMPNRGWYIYRKGAAPAQTGAPSTQTNTQSRQYKSADEYDPAF